MEYSSFCFTFRKFNNSLWIEGDFPLLLCGCKYNRKGKSLIIKLLPFLLWQAAKPSPGRGVVWFLLPRAMPWAMCFCPFGACYSWVLTHSHPNKSYFNIARLVYSCSVGALETSAPPKCATVRVRRPIGLRSPSDQIPFAVRSDCVRLRTTFRDVLPTIKYCTHAYLLLFNRLYSWYIARFVRLVPLWATKRA